jgi:hypothetical protein
MGLTGLKQINASDIGTVDTAAQEIVGSLAAGTALILVGTNTAVYQTDTSNASTVKYSGNIYIYLAGCANTIVGSVVTYTHAGATVLADTSTAVGLPLAVATGLTSSTSKWGWYLVLGTGCLATNNDVSANTRMQTTATGGMVDDTTTANKYVNGLIARGATTASGAAVTIGQVTFPIANLAV